MKSTVISRDEGENFPSSDSVFLKLTPENFPKNWAIVRLGDVLDVQGGSQPPKSEFIFEPRAGYVRLLQIRDFGEKPVPTYVPNRRVSKFCDRSDILIARYGASLGRIVTGMEGAYNVALAKTIFDKSLIYPRYLFYLLQTPLFQTPIHMISRSAQNGFNKGEIFPIEIPLAPFEQQTRIVAEIEKQFSRLDEAVTNLKRVKANLKRYKAAVLKAAVEGKLTEEWRKQHPDVEPADTLLERILAERRKVAGKGKYKEPVGPDTSGLPELPEGWVWARLGTLPVNVFDGPFGSNLKSSDYVSSGIRVIRLENIGSRQFIDERESFITEQKYEELRKHTVRHGDIIFSSFVANETRVVMLPDHIEKAINKADCFCVRVNNKALNTRYLETCLATRITYEQLVGEVHGATRPRINTTQLKDCHIPIPPVEEQAEIVSRLSSMLSVVEVSEAQVDVNLRRADRLRQSILKKAFSGQLLPQDPNDEPASLLLERMRANASVGARHAVPKTRTEPQRSVRAQDAVPLRATKPAPAAPDDFTSLDSVLAAILNRMKPGHEYSRAEIADPLGLSPGRWNAAIQELKRRGQVRQVGERRGARYVMSERALL